MDSSNSADGSEESHALPLTFVAVGASAGGLDALRELFAAAVADPQLVYIVITHLPIDHVSHLADLLGRAGSVPTSDAWNGERLEGGHVYVAPPGKLLSLHQGKVIFDAPSRLLRPAPKPIDYFMCSMAEDACDRCVGVVLSGTDHDGTVGLKAIQCVGGLTIVQSPVTAEFPGMPNSAIGAGAADLVLTPAAVPSALSDFLGAQNAERELAATATSSSEAGPSVMAKILELVLARTGNDFRRYRPAMLQRRLKRRMSVMQCVHAADYVDLLNDLPDEASTLSSEFLIGVTNFFRDPALWLELEGAVLSPLIAQLPPDDATFRVWTPACSSGEESYSIAMVVLDLFDKHHVEGSVQVFGTDIDGEALAAARQGLYHDSITSTVSAERLARFFDRRCGQFAIRTRLRQAVTFAPQNLVQDTPFSKLDLICCRNLLMYFEPGLQDRVFQLFHFALKPGGLLWLGKAESLGAAHGALFETVSSSMRLFRRIGGRSQLPRGFHAKTLATDVLWQRGGPPRSSSLADIMRDQLGTRKVTAAVLVDRDGRALYFSGQTARFLEPEGEATLELLWLLRKELRPSARIMLRQAAESEQPVNRSVTLPTRRDATIRQHVELQAQRIAPPEARGLVLVTFAAAQMGAVGPQEAATALQCLESEMLEARQELASALEDAERTNEELRIANEEGSALYEEVQASNEELESSTEELQALNEELSTVNALLEEKIVETSRNADDLRNLLDSTHIATLLLDLELRLRRFTPFAGEIFRLRAGDEGRLLSDIAANVHDATLFDDARLVLDAREAAVTELAGQEGKTWLRRILPYVGHHGRTEGVVVTFVDVTVLRAAARQIGQLTAVLDDSNDAVYSCDLNGRILSWNKGAERTYGFRREEALSMSASQLSAPQGQAADVAANAGADGIEHGALDPVDVVRVTKDGQIVTVSMTTTASRDDEGTVNALLFTERDISQRLRVESEIRFRRLADDIPALLRVEDAACQTKFVNRGCAEFIGQSAEILVGKGWLEFVHPQDKHRFLDEYAAAQAEQRQLDSDIRLRRHDGAYRWMRSMSVPHVDASGAFAGYVALMVDVEDRKLAELQLVEADLRKDEFLAMLAHELRNPLAPIRSAVTILSKSDGPGARTQWAIGVIDRQAELMAKLLDGLLDVARISRGKMTLDLVPVELSVVIQRALEISQASVAARQQKLTVQFADEVVVEGDLLRLTQVFANLLNNASKYTDEKGTIDVRVDLDNDLARVRIEDNGAGISAAMLPRVFDLFSQADTTLDRAKGGLGLGLTLVQQLVELHGGTVHAESPGLGAGSTFTVRLPFLRSNTPPPEPRSTREEGHSPAARRVLVVDDNVDGAESLAAVLEMEGHQVCIAYDGHQAVQQATQWRPDVVLLDIGLPGMDGYQVARALRGAGATCAITLIALTGYGQPEDMERARSAGFDHHLVKPIDLDVVTKLVAGALRVDR
jgi:two-component system CheB/CheR fusion protein